MKILFISQFAGSPHHGMVTRNYNWGVEMTRMGHDVTIIGSAYSHYRNKQPTMGALPVKIETIDGIKYMWLEGKPYNGKSSLGRIKAMVNFLYRLSSFARKNDEHYDIVIASSPQPFIIYSAHKIAKRNGAKLVYDIRDLWPLTLKELGGMSQYHPFIMALQHAENYACKHADLVTAVPQNCKDYLTDHNMNEDKFLHIGNGHVIQENAQSDLPTKHAALIKKLKNDGKFIIGYAGTHGRANAMHAPIKALKKAHSHIHLVCVGQGNEKQDLIQIAKNNGLADRVHFLDPIHHTAIPNFLSSIDIAYIGAINSSLYKWGASPAKINDYLMAAKPILYTIGDPKNPIELSGCGLCCEAENTEQISDAMNQLHKTTAQDLKEMGERGKEWLFKNQLTSIQVDKILGKLTV